MTQCMLNNIGAAPGRVNTMNVRGNPGGVFL
jgi:hypothetical protein